jgi:hypothetical protein
VISILSKLDPRTLDRAAVAVSLTVVAQIRPAVEAVTAAFAPDGVLDASAGDRWLGLAGRDPQWSAR